MIEKMLKTINYSEPLRAVKADVSCLHVNSRFSVLKVARIEPPPHS